MAMSSAPSERLDYLARSCRSVVLNGDFRRYQHARGSGLDVTSTWQSKASDRLNEGWITR